jgi:hypothetical protein
MDAFKSELIAIINSHNIDTKCDMPDFEIADFLCERLQELIDANEECPDPGEMDGDMQTALASAGWGTDEDYGGTDDE